jgi:GNAT superfamily N-acetyltransferase
MTDGSVRVVPLGEDRDDEATALIGRAFRDDPLFAHACPDPAVRARWLPWSFLWSLTKGRLYGALLGIGDPLAGVAIAVGPGAAVDDANLVAATARARAARRRTLTPGEAAAFDGFDEASGAVFTPADAALYRSVPGPHWYLDVIAVDPARQGTGLGGALLGAVHARADADGVPVVLLTYEPTNLPFYRRHGYAVVCEGTPPASGPPWWGMRRPASVPIAAGGLAEEDLP